MVNSGGWFDHNHNCLCNVYDPLWEIKESEGLCMANWSAICCRKLPQQKACTITKIFTKRLERDGMFMQLQQECLEIIVYMFHKLCNCSPDFGVCTQESCNDIIMMLTMCTFEWVHYHEVTKRIHFPPYFHVNAFFSKTQVLLSISICASLFVQIKLKSRVVGFDLNCTLVLTISHQIFDCKRSSDILYSTQFDIMHSHLGNRTVGLLLSLKLTLVLTVLVTYWIANEPPTYSTTLCCD